LKKEKKPRGVNPVTRMGRQSGEGYKSGGELGAGMALRGGESMSIKRNFDDVGTALLD